MAAGRRAASIVSASLFTHQYSQPEPATVSWSCSNAHGWQAAHTLARPLVASTSTSRSRSTAGLPPPPSGAKGKNKLYTTPHSGSSDDEDDHDENQEAMRPCCIPCTSAAPPFADYSRTDCINDDDGDECIRMTYEGALPCNLGHSSLKLLSSILLPPVPLRAALRTQRKQYALSIKGTYILLRAGKDQPPTTGAAPSCLG